MVMGGFFFISGHLLEFWIITFENMFNINKFLKYFLIMIILL